MTAHTVAIAALCLLSTAAAQDIRKGLWKNRKPPEGWIVHRTRGYQIQSQAGKEKAERLGAHMDAMLRIYRKSFRVDKAPANRYAVKLFKDRESFLAYGASPSAAAYYDPVDREMVCYDTGKWADDPPATGGAKRRSRTVMDTLGNAAHEGWHQYFHWYITSWVQIPSWINEGMGDYFYCAKPVGEGRRRTADLGAINRQRMPAVWGAVNTGQNVPIAELITMSKKQFYDKGTICYPQGWALCHFLQHHEDKRYRAVVPTYIRLIRDDTNFEAITERAFRGIDLDTLNEEYEQWVLGPAVEQYRAEGKSPAEDKKKSAEDGG